MCKNCHNTHRSTGSKLEKPDFETLPQLDIYCNACHDGTVAPIPNNWNSDNQHNYRVNNPTGMGADTCANCHNPHLNWTESNPNFLQDAYYYTHNDPTNPYLPKSSDEQLCEGCHEATIKDDPRVTYELFKYKKRHTTTGAFEDYKLCLRCHDGESAVDIATYYNTPSGHSITAPADGSPINGALACADCHETHGSNNLKLLKEDLGHQVTQKFQTPSTEWDFVTERQFCTKCHNNSTVVYGKTVPFNETILGHEITSIEFCSKCHGGGSVIKAAHGPVTP
jgi:predicted CXXCH cytochrome family protein